MKTRISIDNLNREIAERKRVEEALNVLEVRYRRLFETAKDGILLLDAETGMIADVNPFLIEMLGFSHEQFMGKAIWEIGLFKDIASNKDKFIELQRRRYVRYEDLPLETADGRRIEVEFVSNVYTVDHQKMIQCNIRDITERKQAEQVAKEAREYAESIVETVREPLIVLDAGLKVISANHSFYQTFKVNPEESKGQFIYDLGNRQWDIPKLRTLLEDILPKNNVFDNYEIEHDFETIGPKTMLLNARRLDTVQMVLLAIEDITERKQAERDLHESKNYLENLINYANAPIIVWTPDSKITKFNHAFEHLTGRSTEEVLGKELSILFPKENCEQVLLEIKRTLSGNNWESVEIPILNKDGSIRVALWNSANIYAENGTTLTATIAQGVDITNRKRAEDALRESQDRYRALVENTVLGVTVIDTNYKIITANTMLAKLFNKPASDFVGKNCFREYEKREAVCSHCPGVQAMTSGKTTEVETQGVRDDGSRFYVRNRAIPLFGPDGVAKGFIELVEDITDRKKAEEAKRRLVAIIEATPDFVGFADAKDKHIIYVNKAGRKMCGIGNDEDVTKLKISDVHPEWTNKMFAEEILPAAVRDGTWTGECAFLDIRDRHEIPVSMVLSSHKASNGEVEVFSTISRDITERNKAEEYIKKQNEFVETAINSLQWPFYVIGTDCTIILSNKAAKEKGVVEGGRCYQLTHRCQEPCSGEHICPLKEVIRTGKSTVTEHIHFDNHGNGRNFEVHGDPIFDKDGQVIQMIEYSIDITERKQADEALRESEERYKSLFKANIDGILIADPTTKKFRYANPAMCRMLGYSEEELTQMGVADIHPKESLEQVFAEFEALASGAKITAKDLLCVRKDGQVISVSINAGMVIIGQTKYLLAIFRDITERQQAEQHQAQLLEQLEKTNKELNDFAYVISHDLKAPLRGIKTITEWITTDYADKLDDNGKEQMNLLERRVDRMHNLIDGVLQYSRVGRVKEDMVQINLNELISEAIDSLAPPENISITIETELPAIKCERTRIMQVFQNLLSNAVKYMDKPQGQIKIGCIEENGFWKFSVADNGPGIEEKYFEKIFQLFQTLAPRDESESTGVGLTVVKKIIEMYKGSVWVESEVGNGSTFFFTLPKQKRGVKNEKLQANIVS